MQRFPPLLAIFARNNFECLVLFQFLNPFAVGYIQRHLPIPHSAKHTALVPFCISAPAYCELVAQIINQLAGVRDFSLFVGQGQFQCVCQEVPNVCLYFLCILAGANNSYYEVIRIAVKMQTFIFRVGLYVIWSVQKIFLCVLEGSYCFMCLQQLQFLLFAHILSPCASVFFAYFPLSDTCFELLLVFPQVVVQFAHIDIGKNGADP